MQNGLKRFVLWIMILSFLTLILAVSHPPEEVPAIPPGVRQNIIETNPFFLISTKTLATGFFGFFAFCTPIILFFMNRREKKDSKIFIWLESLTKKVNNNDIESHLRDYHGKT